MTNPFEPIGEKARWRIIFNILATTDIDEVVTYETFATALDLDPKRDRATIQKAMRRASIELLQKRNRAVEAVRGKGYRIVRPEEQLRLAQYHQQRASKALERGASTAQHVDFNGMNQSTRHAFEMTARALGAVIDYNRRLDTRQKRLEESMALVSQRQERTDAETTKLRERLERLEAKLNTSHIHRHKEATP